MSLLQAQLDALDAKFVERPSRAIPMHYWEAVRHLSIILDELPFAGMHLNGAAPKRRAVLDRTVLLMHEIASFQEYLTRVVWATLDPGTEKRHATQLCKSLELEINLLFKVPVNKVKHDGFKLRWTDQTRSNDRIKGYIVQGMVAVATRGPGNRRFGDEAIAEGYSFAHVLRMAFQSFYTLSALTAAGLGLGPLTAPMLNDHARDTDGLLVSMLPKLNALPLKGFPNERGFRISLFGRTGQAVGVLRTATLGRLKHESRFETEMGDARSGDSVVLPYWNKGQP